MESIRLRPGLATRLLKPPEPGVKRFNHGTQRVRLEANEATRTAATASLADRTQRVAKPGSGVGPLAHHSAL